VRSAIQPASIGCNNLVTQEASVLVAAGSDSSTCCWKMSEEDDVKGYDLPRTRLCKASFFSVLPLIFT
jgi:hypothetical protein